MPAPYVVRQPAPLRGSTRYNVHDRATDTLAGSVVKTSVGLKSYVWKAAGVPNSDYPFLTRGRAAAAVWATWRLRAHALAACPECDAVLPAHRLVCSQARTATP